MRPKILLLDEPHPKARAIMEEVAELDTEWCGYKECCGRYDGVYIQLTQINSKNIPDDINFIACPCTGIDHLDVPPWIKIIYLDEQWKSKEGQEITSTAEHTLSLMLQIAKLNKIQLSDKKLGIIGCGRIGTMVSEMAWNGFNMNLLIYDKYKKHIDLGLGDEIWRGKADDFKKVLQESDIITIHVPLNEETKGMIGEKEFNLMKDTALLINTSRAEIVNSHALLNSNVAGYADDFLESHGEYFINKLKEKMSVIMTPHIGGNCLEAREATDIYIANKIKEYIKERYQ